VVCIWFFHAPLEHHANPQVTPLHTTAPWYFLWLQGMLKLGDKIFWGLVIPTVLLGMFFVWPYLDVSRSRRYAHRRFGLSLMLIFITIMWFLSYMGTPKYGVETAGDQEIAQELAPVEGIGPVRAMRFENWVNGTYCTDDLTHEHQLPIVNWGADKPAPPPVVLLPQLWQPVTCQAVPEGAMMELMQKYVHEMDRFDAKLPNAVGVLNVSDAQTTSEANQTDLKRIDIQIIWDVPDVNAQNALQFDESGHVKLKQAENVDIDAAGTKGTRPAVQMSGKALFLNRLSEYQGE
jgi:hypothetical protein